MANSAPRILVVDYHIDLADSVCEFLNLSGHEATAVYTAEQAAGACRTGRPGVALLDFRIGAGMNGI